MCDVWRVWGRKKERPFSGLKERGGEEEEARDRGKSHCARPQLVEP